jgi:hypothetical protein
MVEELNVLVCVYIAVSQTPQSEQRLVTEISAAQKAQVRTTWYLNP